jgi:hypothetical protein
MNKKGNGPDPKTCYMLESPGRLGIVGSLLWLCRLAYDAYGVSATWQMAEFRWNPPQRPGWDPDRV